MRVRDARSICYSAVIIRQSLGGYNPALPKE
jgi:hypothetical protein